MADIARRRQLFPAADGYIAACAAGEIPRTDARSSCHTANRFFSRRARQRARAREREGERGRGRGLGIGDINLGRKLI